MGSTPINIVVKLTRNCNFRCEYCHDLAFDSQPMSFETLAYTIQRMLSWKDESAFRFIWHGGEPLLRGHDFFLKILALQEKFRREGQKIQNNIQTNGYLIDNKFIDLFDQYGVTMGVSLDGPSFIHDAQRRNTAGEPTFDSVMQAIRRLQARNIPFGALSVLTSRSLATPPKKFLKFYQENGINNVGFLPVRSSNALEGESLPAEEYAAYITRMFDEWLRLDDPNLRIREFSDWIALSLGLPGILCSSNGGCAGTTFSVDLDGSIYCCDKFVNTNGFCYGNIKELNFNRLKQSEEFLGICAKAKRLASKCQNCQWNRFCAGGCMHDNYLMEVEQVNEPC